MLGAVLGERLGELRRREVLAVVGHDGVDADVQLLEPVPRVGPERSRGDSAFVVVGLHTGDPAVVVRRDMQIGATASAAL